MKLTTTKDAGQGNGVNILVYGNAGTGKTHMCQTAPKPLIISAESGLMSLRDVDIPVIEVKSYDDLLQAYTFITTDPGAEQFETICLDSISEIAEVILDHEKSQVKDVRQAYGELITKTMSLCRAFRDLNQFNVYFSAKQEKIKDELSGALLYSPSMPGTKLGVQLSYLFDIVACLRSGKDEEGKVVRSLQTFSDVQYSAKDRSSSLAEFETPDLTIIFNKIKGTK